MAQVEKVKTLNFGDKVLEVESMSEHVQQVVALFDNANAREVEVVQGIDKLNAELNLVRFAKNGIHQELLVLVKKELDAVAAKEESVVANVAPTEAVANV